MTAGRKPEWPEDVRAAVIAAVMDEGQTLLGTIRRLHEGKLGRLGKVPVPASTARSWIDTAKRQKARGQRPDLAAWNAAADRFWRVIDRELVKLERQAAKAESIDPKRLNGFLTTLKDARDILESKDRDEGQPGDAPMDGLAERLAAQQQHSQPQPATPAQPATPNPPTLSIPTAESVSQPRTTIDAETDGGDVGPVPIAAST
jgi:hypothetical protein